MGPIPGKPMSGPLNLFDVEYVEFLTLFAGVVCPIFPWI